jgi:adenylate cyclase
MFVDLRAFTRFSETVAPEEVANLLAEYRELVTQAVFRNGGVVDKFIGDGVMAAFGQPHAASDDAQRALRCALELATSLRAWRDSRLSSGKAALDAGIGLHYGMVIGGILESGSHDEFTLFGDAVNVAQRLERLCRALDAAIMVSRDVVLQAGAVAGQVHWKWQDAAELNGRAGRLKVGYLPQASQPNRRIE